MIVFDAIIYDLQGVAGISKYFSALLSGINTLRLGDLEVLISDRSVCRLPPDVLGAARLQRPRIFERVRAARLSQYSSLSSNAVFHSSYYRVPDDRSVPTVVTVHDMIHELIRTDISSRVLREQKQHALKRASHIITISESTRTDLLRLYPSLNGKPITTIYNGVSDDFRPPDDEADRQDLIFVGNRQLYKDFAFALAAAAASKHRSLHIVGGGALTPSERSQVEACCSNRYHIHQNITDQELSRLYGRSLALVYPSRYEGFGLPALEAMRAGCIPVFRSMSSLPEVVGMAGIDIAGRSAEAVMDELDGLSQSAIGVLQGRGFEQARKFSWDSCAAQTNAVYESLLN